MDKTIYWIYYLIALVGISLFWGKKWLAGFLLLVLLGLILTWEWNSGFFMNRYRKKERKRLDEMRQNEDEEEGKQ